MPFLVIMTVPFIVLFASMATLMALNRRFELVVARSVGVSAWQFLTPLCAASFLVGLFAVGVVNPLSAWSFARAGRMEAMIRQMPVQDSQASQIPWLRQRTDDGVMIIGADSTAERGLSLVNPVFIRLMPDNTILERIDADTALLSGTHWHLKDGTRYTSDGPKKFKELDIKSGLTPEMVEQRLANPESIPFYELPEKIGTARALGMQGSAFAMQLHSLAALPPLLVAMTLIAATVTMRFARMGQSAALILGGIIAGFLLYVVTVVVTAFGRAGLIPPVMAAWFPVVVAMFVGVAFLLFKEDG